MKNTLNDIAGFLSDIAIENTYTSIWTVSRITNVVKWQCKWEDLTDLYWKENKYFLANVDNWDGMRSKYNDISKRKYIFFDIDIRKDLKLWDTEDLTPHVDSIIDKLDKSEWFYQWDYVVFSWNWIHIYYIDDFVTEIRNQNEHDNIRFWIWEACDEITKITWYEADKWAAKISQIIRLPWTINKKDWLSAKECYIYKVNDKKFENKINTLDLCNRIWTVELTKKKALDRKRLREVKKRQENWDVRAQANAQPDLLIEFAHGASQRLWDVSIEVGETKPCQCPNPLHDDKHASAYVGRSNSGDKNCFVKCSGWCDIIWSK